VKVTKIFTNNWKAKLGALLLAAALWFLLKQEITGRSPIPLNLSPNSQISGI